MAKPEKTAAAPTENAAKPNSKKLALIAIGVLLLAAGGGAGWFFTKGSHHAEEFKAPPPPKFVALEPFTVNLQHDSGDQFLQISMTLKFTDPELEEKIKLHSPEIRSHLLLLLASKRAAELTPPEGKKKLMREIVAETSAVLGLRAAFAPAPAPKVVVRENADPPQASAVAGEAASAPAEAAPAPAPPSVQYETYLPPPLEVLFTSFIIQ